MSGIDPAVALTEYGVFVFSTVCHEAAHATAALKLGDSTAHEGGQVSLDPIPHIRREPFGMVLVPLIGLMSGGMLLGWASTPYDPYWADRYPKRAAWMALAGPAANLALVLLAALLIRVGIFTGHFYSPELVSFTQVAGAAEGLPGAVAMLLSVVFSLNLALFFFNLLPFPPLDGASLPALLPGERGLRFARALQAPAFRLIGLLIAWQAFPYVYRPLRVLALNLLYPGAHYQ
jgi:Zn-dependent protease